MLYLNRTLASVMAIASILPSAAAAAEISVSPLEETKDVMILIDGDIQKGDDEKFRKIAAEHSDAIVLLNSDGGAIAPAMDIGRTIKLREYSTAVYNDSSCASACALIWIAGIRRAIFDGGKVGFHASYLDVNGTMIETGMGNALVGHYLAQLGMGQKTVIFATAAAPDKILWLNAETASISGIEYRTIPTRTKAKDVESKGSSTDLQPPQITTISTPSLNNPNVTRDAKHPTYERWMGDAKATLRTPEAFAEGLRGKGYQATITYSDPDSPSLATGVGGEQFTIAFSGCENKNCKYIQFLDFYTDVSRVEADSIIDYMQEDETYSHIYYNKKQNTFGLYNYIVIGIDGITLNTLIENMNYFIRSNKEIEKKILDRRAGK